MVEVYRERTGSGREGAVWGRYIGRGQVVGGKVRCGGGV